MTNDKGTVTLVLVAAAVGASFLVADHLSTPFDNFFEAAGKKWKLDPNLLRAFAKHESGMNPKAIGAPNANGSRDYGLMQLNDRTLTVLGKTTADALDPGKAIDAAGSVLSRIKTELGDKLTVHTLVASYNAGSPSIKKRGVWNFPYVSSVMTHYQLYSLGRMFA